MSSGAVNRTLQLPTDATGKHINRAMGAPVVSYDQYLGSATKFVDLLDLKSDAREDRVFHGIHVRNPSAAAILFLALTDEFGEDVCMAIPPQVNMVFDGQTFGYGVLDETLGKKISKLRAKLSIATGVLAAGTIDYSGSGNPSDGDQFTLNGRTYEFHNDGSVSSDSVVPIAIGASADISWTNAINAINTTEQAVTATIDTVTDIVTITSNYGGTTGNAISFADVSTGAVFSGATLTGGSGGVLPIIHIW